MLFFLSQQYSVLKITLFFPKNPTLQQILILKKYNARLPVYKLELHLFSNGQSIELLQLSDLFSSVINMVTIQEHKT